MVQVLLDANPECIRARQGRHTLLHSAACNAQSADVVQLLVSIWAGAAAERDEEGNAPLHFACACQASPAVVKALLSLSRHAAGHLSPARQVRLRGAQRWATSAAPPSQRFRSPRTSYEYDVYTWTWAVNEYCIRQGHGSYVEVVEAGQSATSCSSTGFLKPTYDEQGRMKVMRPEMLLAVIMDMAAGSKEMSKDGHKDDRPFPSGRMPLSRRCRPGPGSLMACPA